MSLQACNRCQRELPLESYNWRWKKRGVRQRTCRDCQKLQKKSWYQNNSDKHKANVYRRKLANIVAGREYVREYLQGNPCERCGESDLNVLEFDHVRGKKRAAVMKLLRDGHTLTVIRAEIAKCRVVCANCHKRKTYKDSWRNV